YGTHAACERRAGDDHLDYARGVRARDHGIAITIVAIVGQIDADIDQRREREGDCRRCCVMVCHDWAYLTEWEKCSGPPSLMAVHPGGAIRAGPRCWPWPPCWHLPSLRYALTMPRGATSRAASSTATRPRTLRRCASWGSWSRRAMPATSCAATTLDFSTGAAHSSPQERLPLPSAATPLATPSTV